MVTWQAVCPRESPISCADVSRGRDFAPCPFVRAEDILTGMPRGHAAGPCPLLGDLSYPGLRVQLCVQTSRWGDFAHTHTSGFPGGREDVATRGWHPAGPHGAGTQQRAALRGPCPHPCRLHDGSSLHSPLFRLWPQREATGLPECFPRRGFCKTGDSDKAA